jgi:hypothetical protein
MTFPLIKSPPRHERRHAASAGAATAAKAIVL